MGNEDKILRYVGRRTGMKVPDGYFDKFVVETMANLPEYPEKPVARPMTRWQRIKPYVYMAAMFAGIWCMMKLFHIASQNATSADLDNPPQAVVLALDDSETFEYFYEESPTSADMSEYDVEEAVSMEINNIDDFEKEFGYEIKPEYDNII